MVIEMDYVMPCQAEVAEAPWNASKHRLHATASDNQLGLLRQRAVIVSASWISIRTQRYGWAAGGQTGPLRGNLAFPEIIIIFIPSEVGDIAHDTLDTVRLLMLLFLLTVVQLLYRWNDDGGSRGTGRQKWQCLMWGAVRGADATVGYGRLFRPTSRISPL